MGDRGPVMNAMYEIVGAAGELEHSQEALRRAIAVAQEEFTALRTPPDALGWTGANTPAESRVAKDRASSTTKIRCGMRGIPLPGN